MSPIQIFLSEISDEDIDFIIEAHREYKELKKLINTLSPHFMQPIVWLLVKEMEDRHGVTMSNSQFNRIVGECYRLEAKRKARK